MTLHDDTFDDGEGNPVMVNALDEASHPKPSDSVFDAFPVYQPEMRIHPADGLPVDHTPDAGEDAFAPVLDPTTLVCMRMKDESGNVVRKQCSFYKRQKMGDPDMPGIQVIQRWCVHPSACGVGGGAMSLRDSIVPCCELREPPDETSVNELDAFDDMKIEQGKRRVFFQMFKSAEDVKSGRTKVENPVTDDLKKLEPKS